MNGNDVMMRDADADFAMSTGSNDQPTVSFECGHSECRQAAVLAHTATELADGTFLALFDGHMIVGTSREDVAHQVMAYSIVDDELDTDDDVDVS
jgi:hypothetical protein